MADRECKDCIREGISSKRPAPHPGPRCVTHHRIEKKRISAHEHSRSISQNYEITEEEYWALYKAQGGRCFVCQLSTGALRRLAVDHDHKCTRGHPPERGCRYCIRALLCKRCNQLVAWWGIEALQRGIVVLTDPPARKVLVDERVMSSD